MFEVVDHGLDHDNGVVHDNSNGQHQAEHGESIQREAQSGEEDKGADERHGDGD